MQALIRTVVLLASLFIPSPLRRDWRREWYGEIWWWWFRHSDCVSIGVRVKKLVGFLAGAIRDAVTFAQAERAGHSWGLWQEFGWLAWPALATCVVFIELCAGSKPVTMSLLQSLASEGGARLAVVSLQDRLSARQAGVPEEVARNWQKDSRLLAGVAAVSRVNHGLVRIGKQPIRVSSVRVTPNFFPLFEGQSALPGAGSNSPIVVVSHRLWNRLGTSSLYLDGRRMQVAGVLSDREWFYSPEVDVYAVDSRIFPENASLVVRTRADVSAAALQADLSSSVQSSGVALISVRPQAASIPDALFRPVLVFLVSLASAYLLSIKRPLSIGSFCTSLHFDWRVASIWTWQIARTALCLSAVFVLGVEWLVGRQQSLVEPLGGPQLIWFYLTASTVVFRSLNAAERFRCRVCCRPLQHPVSMGAAGPVLLNWAGTELLCSRDHGTLYVPHYRSTWQGQPYWMEL